MDENKNTFDFDGALLMPLEDFINFYAFHDVDQIYTNGSKLIQIYRLKQWLDYHIYMNDINNDNLKIKDDD